MTDDLDLLLDRMAFADAVRACRGEDITAAECESAFARYRALCTAEDEASVGVTRVLQ
jgi:hypothetical protein